MSFAVVCPKCKFDYQVPDALLGKPVGCRKCEFLFRAYPPGTKPQPVRRPTATVPPAGTNPAPSMTVEAEPQLVVLDESSPEVAEGEPIIPVLVDASDAIPDEQPTRRRRPRPITWHDLERKKRRDEPETEANASRNPRKKPDSASVSIPPSRMARRVGLGVFVVLLVAGIAVAVYYAVQPAETVPPKTVIEQPPAVAPIVDPTTIAALGEPFGILPAPFEGENLTFELDGEIENLSVGGGGRFLVLKIADKNELRIFDLNRSNVVKTIPVASAAKFTAGGRKLVLVDPDRHRLQRWDLFERSLDLEVEIPEGDRVQELVMGSASDGPILELRETPSAFAIPDRHLRFLDLETLAEKPIRNLPQLGAEPRSFRASADGKVFSHWSSLGAGPGNAVMALSGDELHIAATLTSPLIPSADGQTIYTSQGPLTTALKPRKTAAPIGAGVTVPAVHGCYCLNIAAERLAPPFNPGQRGRGVPNIPCKFTLQTAAGQQLSRPLALPFPLPMTPFTTDAPGTDRRALWIPAAKVLVVVPAPSDRLILYRCDPESMLAETDADYLIVTSTPPTEYRRGGTYVYPLEVLSKRGEVRYRLVRGPEGMTVSKDGVVSWSVPADFARVEVRVEVEVIDGAGQMRSCPIRLTLDDRRKANNPFDPGGLE